MSSSSSLSTTNTGSAVVRSASLQSNDDENDDSSSTRTLVASSSSSSAASFSYPSWHNTVAGAAAGAGSRIATAPLDLIRIRRQLMPRTQYPSESLWQSLRQIVRTEEGGLLALFRGNSAALALWMGYAAVQFSLYSSTKEYFTTLVTSSTNAAATTTTTAALHGVFSYTTLVTFAAGAVAGTCATLVTYPFDVCRTTLAVRGMVLARQTNATTTSHLPQTIVDFVRQVYHQRGLVGFYAGVGPAVLQIVPYMGINFAIYEQLTAPSGDHRNNRSNKNKRVLASGYAGAISGAVSKLLVFPLDTIKRRLQAQAVYEDPWMLRGGAAATTATAGPAAGHRLHPATFEKPYHSLWDCGRRIILEEGWTNLYRGVFPSVLKTTISSALTFALFRATKNALEYGHDHGWEQWRPTSPQLEKESSTKTPPRKNEPWDGGENP